MINRQTVLDKEKQKKSLKKSQKREEEDRIK